MASVRKKYQGLVVDHSADPVSSPPPSENVAKPPDAVETPQSAEPIEAKPTPAEEAAKSAIKQRLAEAERAQELTKERAPQPQPQPQFAAEPQAPQMDPREEFEAAIAGVPERAKAWYRADPSWLMDPERAAHLTYAHHVALRETGAEGSDEYFDRMEHMLGLRHAAPLPEPQPLPQRQRSEPAPRQYSGPPVSAPPSRESASLSTGRPTGNGRVTLTREEVDHAKAMGCSLEDYAAGKLRVARERGQGHHRDDQ